MPIIDQPENESPVDHDSAIVTDDLLRLLIPRILHMETGELTHELDPAVLSAANAYMMEMPNGGMIRNDAELHDHARALAHIGVQEKWAREHLAPYCQNWREKFKGAIPNIISKGFDSAALGFGLGSRLHELNETYCAVFASGHYRIMYPGNDPGGLRWMAVSKQDFLSRFENEQAENPNPGKNKPTMIPLGRAWQEWPSRKTADATTFDTTAAPAAVVGSALNLWLGFGIAPGEGSCERFKTMILNDQCSGDRKAFDYILRWIAWKVQHPGLVPEVAIALIGPKGTGKTTLGRTLAAIFGAHGMVAHDIGQITGRFNGHLESKCFVYADEAVWGGDRPNESTLKALITDAPKVYEYKGVTSFTGINRVGLIFAGNENWIVPATLDERRFCVSQVSDKHIAPNDAPMGHPNRCYWDAIHRELDNGGREAFLHEMLNMDLGDWHPRMDVPATKALANQKMLGLKGVQAWYHERLRDGVMLDDVTVNGTASADKWPESELYVLPSEITKAYQDWLHQKNPYAVVTMPAVLNELREFGWDGGKHRRIGKSQVSYWLVPKLEEARAMFSKKLGADVFTGR